jgi:ribosome-associated protein
LQRSATASYLLIFVILTMIDVVKEIAFKTARSGGKGGQNVNKVETMVEGSFHVSSSEILNEEQKNIIVEKLATRITDGGYLQVKSRTDRTQLGNKAAVIKKMNFLINQALIVPKKRKATKPSKASKANRIKIKKEKSIIKEGRKKIKNYDE